LPHIFTKVAVLFLELTQDALKRIENEFAARMGPYAIESTETSDK
jgi:hypothetical protein